MRLLCELGPVTLLRTWPPPDDDQLLAPLPLQHVVLLDQRAEDLRREYWAAWPRSAVAEERTVRDAEFQISHRPLGGDRYLRVGIFRAWQSDEGPELRTLEGRAVAGPGDWIIEGHSGESWPLTDAQFRRTYQPCPEPAGDPASGLPPGPAAG